MKLQWGSARFQGCHWEPAAVKSGLLGISSISASMEDLLRQISRPEAAEAIEFYCYQARQHLAALTATLGGLDRLVFTGGIGANAPSIRDKICAGLEYLGIVIDPKRNEEGARIISTENNKCIVEAVATNEELMIAQHVRRLLNAPRARSLHLTRRRAIGLW